MSGTVTMTQYVSELETATANALAVVWARHAELLALQEELESVTRRVQAEYEAIERLHSLDETPDDVMLTTGRYWENYFGDDKERHAKADEVKELEKKIELQDLSVRASAGSVLEYAKKGIGDVHGGAIPRPGRGRPVGQQFLSEVIWQGRNQAIHAGEGSLHGRTEACMKQLVVDFGQPWPDYLTRSMAFDVLDLLAWREFQDFQRDLLSLA